MIHKIVAIAAHGVTLTIKRKIDIIVNVEIACGSRAYPYASQRFNDGTGFHPAPEGRRLSSTLAEVMAGDLAAREAHQEQICQARS